MKAPSDEMAMRPLTEGTKRRTGLEKRLAWELERWAQALVLSDPVPTLRKTRLCLSAPAVPCVPVCCVRERRQKPAACGLW